MRVSGFFAPTKLLRIFSVIIVAGRCVLAVAWA